MKNLKLLVVMYVKMALLITAQQIPPRQTISKAESPEIASLNSKVENTQSSAKFWTSLYLSLVLFAVILTFGTFVAQYMSTKRSQEVAFAETLRSAEKDRTLSVELRDKDLKIEEARARGASAEEKSAMANERAGRAESHLAEANARATEATARVKEAEAQVALANAASKDAVAKVAEAQQASAEAGAKAEGFRLEIARASQSAAEANRMAEQERLARLELEAKLADWVLTPDQQRRIIEVLSRVKGQTIDVSVIGDTPEIGYLSNALLGCLSAAQMPLNVFKPIGGAGSIRGVLVGAKPGSAPMSEAASAIVSIMRETLGGGVGLWNFDEIPVSARELLVLRLAPGKLGTRC
jgi:hypothetical protein